MIMYVNGSPKLKKSNSEYFLKRISDNNRINYLYKDSFDQIIDSVVKCNTIVFAFPLYVDSPPSMVIKFMEYIKDNNIDISDKNIYVICNSGFWESFQNDTAILIIKCFCDNNKANFKGYLEIGAGEIIGKCDKKKIYKLVSIPFLFKIRKFKKCIDSNSYVSLRTTIRPMGKRLYIFLANINWKRQMIRNNVYEKKITN
ncbi:MAG: hypothetical protein ACI31S_01160 [Bacilli bacterium]